MVAPVASAEVDVAEGGVDRKVGGLLDDQSPLGQGEAEAGQRAVPVCTGMVKKAGHRLSDPLSGCLWPQGQVHTA